MLREEEFCMQTDSHMDVVQDWDAKLMAMWGRVDNEYGILTTYVHKIEQLQEGYENKKEVPHLCQVRPGGVCGASGRGKDALFAAFLVGHVCGWVHGGCRTRKTERHTGCDTHTKGIG